MKTIDWAQAYNSDYTLCKVNSFKQYWIDNELFSCIGKPKIMHMFLYLNGLDAEYTLKDNSKIYANDGTLVYIPMEIEYSTKFYVKQKSGAHSVAIRFLIYDEDNCFFNLSDTIEVFDSIECSWLVKKINAASEASPKCYGELKAGVYELVSLLGKSKKINLLNKYSVIEKGIAYIEQNFEKDFSVKDVADMCNVSEIYFRHLFKEYSGYSPVEYRKRRKIERAKSYLAYDSFNVTQIAELLGYVDTSYFCKQFKEYTGVTPLEYKNNFDNK